MLGSSLGYAAPAITASILSNLNSTATVDWASIQQGQQPQHHNVVNGTTVPATAITTVFECDVCAHPEGQQHQTTNTWLLDTAVQQTAGGGHGAEECDDDDNNKMAMATGETTTVVATPSPQEKWWGGSLLAHDEGSLPKEGPLAVTVDEEDEKSSATVHHHPTAAMAAMWGNLAILSGAMTVAVGVILWQ